MQVLDIFFDLLFESEERLRFRSVRLISRHGIWGGELSTLQTKAINSVIRYNDDRRSGLCTVWSKNGRIFQELRVRMQIPDTIENTVVAVASSFTHTVEILPPEKDLEKRISTALENNPRFERSHEQNAIVDSNEQ